MKHFIRILAVLALVQVGLVVYTQMGSTTLASSTPSGLLLTFDPSTVDGLSIQGQGEGMDSPVKLTRKDGKWQLADGFPADQGKVSNLLEKLGSLKHGLPVATSPAALVRFKVADGSFEREIRLQQGERTLATLYLGSGAGARQTHARNAADQAVYSVALGSYDTPAKPEDWQDKTVLSLDKAEVTGVKLGDLTLTPEAGDAKAANATLIWKAVSLPAGKILDQTVINDKLDSLFALQFRTVLGKALKPEYGMDKPLLMLTVSHKGGEHEYSFGQLKDKEDVVLKVSDREEYFQIPGYVSKPLLEGLTAEKWLMDEPVATATPAPASPPAGDTPATPAKQPNAPEASAAIQSK